MKINGEDGFIKVCGKQRTKFGRWSAFPQSKDLCSGANWFLLDHHLPTGGVVSPSQHCGQPIISLIPCKMTRKSSLDMILILTLMLISPDSLLEEYGARQEMSKKHYWGEKSLISHFRV